MEYSKINPMPADRVAKCRAKFERFLTTNANELHIVKGTVKFITGSQYGGFGGYSYRVTMPGLECEVEINHDGNESDFFTVHWSYLKYLKPMGNDHVRFSDAFPFMVLLGGLTNFYNLAVEEGKREIEYAKLRR